MERFVPVGSDSLLTLQGALAEPLTTAKTPDASLDEDNGKPNVEGRIALGSGKPEPIGIGLVTQRPRGDRCLRRGRPLRGPPFLRRCRDGLFPTSRELPSTTG